jgi:hypothetical protein
MAASEDGHKTTKVVDVKDQAPLDSGDESGASSIEHPFSDPEIADRWRKVYEKAEYENRHRFDPSFTWTDSEEKKLVRKVIDPAGHFPT